MNSSAVTWRGAGAAERTGFENQRGVRPRRGFKSLPLRHAHGPPEAARLERCPSGLRSTLGKRVCRFPAPRVQIPPSPPTPGMGRCLSWGELQDPGVGPVLAMGQGRIGSGRERSSPKIIAPCVSDRALSRVLRLSPPAFLIKPACFPHQVCPAVRQRASSRRALGTREVSSEGLGSLQSGPRRRRVGC